MSHLPRTLLLSSSLIFIGVLLSIFFNNNLRVGFGIFKSWFLIPILFAFALHLILRSTVDIENVFKSIYFSSVAVGFIAIIFKSLGIVTYDNRLTAFYPSPNYLAMYLVPGIFFGSYFLIASYFQNKFSRRTIFHILMLSFISIPLYFTYSYGAWIALLLSSFITALTLKPIKKRLFIISLFLFVCLSSLFMLQADTRKFSDLLNLSEHSSFASRMMIWKASILLIKQNPMLGIGAGNFQNSYLAVQPYFPHYLEWAVPQPHNIFFAFWLQAGILGLFGFVWLLFFIFHALHQMISHKKNVALATPLFGFFVYTISHGMFDTTYWKNDLAFLFWICVFLTLFLFTCHPPLNEK